MNMQLKITSRMNLGSVVAVCATLLFAPPARSEPLAGPPQDGPVDRWPACWRDGVQGAACERDGLRETAFETRAGFVNRWSVAGPLDDRALQRVTVWSDLIAWARRQNAFEARVEEGARLTLRPSERLGKKDRAKRWVLAADVHSDANRPARLRFAVNGRATVIVNGREVTTTESDEYLLPDERFVDIELNEGWNTIHVGLTQVSGVGVVWMMRLRGVDHRPLRGVAWDFGERGYLRGTPPTSRCAGLGAELEVAPGGDTGWVVRGRLTAPGLLPQPLPRTVALGWDGQVASLAELAPGLDALAQQVVSIDGLLPAGAEGKVALSVDGETCATVSVGGLEREVTRYRAATAALEGLAEVVLGQGGRESLHAVLGEVRELLTSKHRGSPDRKRLPALLTWLEARLADARAERPPFMAPGVHLRAFASPLDGTLQRYVVLVPKNHGAALKKLGATPVVMLSHGLEYTAEDMLSIALGEPAGPGQAFARGRLLATAPPSLPDGALLVAHDGYGNAGQRAPGRVDVLHVLDDVARTWPIDTNRVAISGFSLGGSVTFWASLYYAERFAGAAPHCGYPNLHDYTSVRKWRKRPWEQVLLEQEGVVGYVENGRQVPMRMVHGTKDNPKRSQLIHERYQELGYSSELELPVAGHNIWDAAFEDGSLLEWLASRRRNPRPAHVTLRTARYRTARLDWVRIDRFITWGPFVEVDATAKKARIDIRTANVDALTLLQQRLPQSLDNRVTVHIDGTRLADVELLGDVHLARGDKGWEIMDAPRNGAKRAGREGPLNDIHHDPWTLVVGTLDPSQVEANRLVADRWRSPAPWIRVRPPVIDDTAFEPEKLAGRHIVLVGGPGSNRITARYREHLAQHGIHFEADAIRVGSRRFAGETVGISVAVPSPHDPDRLLVLHAGVGPEGTLGARHLPELSPDVLVYDGRIRAAWGDRILGRREVLFGAFFDRDWRLPE
jgi:poly(3-hydroxybutyrate) depolymerase